MDRHDNWPQSVVVIYSEVKREYFPTREQYLTEKDSKRDAGMVAKYLKRMGLKVWLIAADKKLVELLNAKTPDMAINMVGSVKGNEYLASAIPGILEMLDIPYTGAGILGEALAYNKFLVKKLLQQNGVPVPNFQLMVTAQDMLDPTLRFPLISKLNEVHGAVEISQDSVSENEKHLRDRLRFLISTYEQPVLVEEFIVGREVTAILFEGYKKKVYVGEKVFEGTDGFRLATFEAQWGGGGGYSYQKYSDAVLNEYVKRAFAITKMADYGKFDVRLDSSGRYYFIDVNSNPAFGPKELDVAMANIMDLYGVTFRQILERLIQNTRQQALS